MNYGRIHCAVTGALSLAFGLTAPVAVPIALCFTKKHDVNLAWSWYDTPDEPDLYDEDMKAVRWVAMRLGWRAAAYYWFGFRNRGHGFRSLFASRAYEHWPPDFEGMLFDMGGAFLLRKRFLRVFVFVFGYQVYASKKFLTGLEYRPMLSIKLRIPKAANV